ncbi:hypothetical protein KCP73_03655 [Salmonella enterica subsp. enterica]|nr:hypothetical protein KCP73_03655 [Salmonella enterica subsp. enterica]
MKSVFCRMVRIIALRRRRCFANKAAIFANHLLDKTVFAAVSPFVLHDNAQLCAIASAAFGDLGSVFATRRNNRHIIFTLVVIQLAQPILAFGLISRIRYFG